MDPPVAPAIVVRGLASFREEGGFQRSQTTCCVHWLLPRSSEPEATWHSALISVSRDLEGRSVRGVSQYQPGMAAKTSTPNLRCSL